LGILLGLSRRLDMQLYEVLKKFKPTALKIKDADGNLYIVGGAVRNFIQCKEPHDIDFCVTGISVDTFRELFPEARQQGKQFPVFVIEDCEFAMARTEKKVGVGYNGFEFFADPSVSIEDDLYRRDLTINSVAIEVLTGKVIDPYNGLYDLERQMLNVTSNAFLEDPTRVIRAARFSCEYPDFWRGVSLLKSMNKIKDELKYVQPDQKLSELRKVFASNTPSRFFDTLQVAEVLDEVFKEVYLLIAVPQAHHEDGDCFEHTMRVLDYCRTLTDDPCVLFAALTHDLGKATTPKEMLPAHHDHENRSVEIIDKIDWIPNEWKVYAKIVAGEHMRGHRFTEMKRGKKVTLLEKIHKSSRGLDGFCKVLYADKPTPETMKNIVKMHETYARIYSIKGDDIPKSTPSGKVFGDVLHQKRAESI
jgi:tRNA nucleotidyltransferase (CCA-adding enzyme)